jgi:hypothetical protein
MTNFVITLEMQPTINESYIEYLAESLKPPGNMSKAASIQKWKDDVKPNLIRNLPYNNMYEGFGIVAMAAIAPSKVDIDDDEISIFTFSSYPTTVDEEHTVESTIIDDLISFMKNKCVEDDTDLTLTGHSIDHFILPTLRRQCYKYGMDYNLGYLTDIETFDVGIDWAGNKYKTDYPSLAKLCTLMDIDTSNMMNKIDIVEQFYNDDYSGVVEHLVHKLQAVNSLIVRL